MKFSGTVRITEQQRIVGVGTGTVFELKFSGANEAPSEWRYVPRTATAEEGIRQLIGSNIPAEVAQDKAGDLFLTFGVSFKTYLHL